MPNSTWRSLIRGLSILVVVVLALGLRLRAVDRLPIDYDEDDYLAAAQRYALAIKSGDLQKIIDYDFNYEHPPLTKLAYALAILPLPEAPLVEEAPPSAPIARSLPQAQFRTARLSGAFFSTLESLALAVVNPLAGFFLAISSWQIKYTSQIMLEPLPALFSMLAALCYYRSKRTNRAWLALSAAGLGLTVASKYPYGVVGLAILADWLWETRPQGGSFDEKKIAAWLKPALLWGAAAIVVFFAANPRMWNDPFQRLVETISFHGGYAASDQVRNAGFPFWQPLVWLFGPVPWHPGVFIFQVDLYISLFALAGMRRTWQKQRVFALWLIIGLGFLLIWPTKWPQYTLSLLAPLSLSAAHGFQAGILEPAAVWLKRLRQPRAARRTAVERGEGRRALPWLLPGLAVLLLIDLYPMLFQGAMSLTDFSATAIRDGLNGGVWREVGEGLTGRAEPVQLDLFGRSTSREVHYAGPMALAALLGGAAPDLLVFNMLWTALAVIVQTGLGLGAALLLHRAGVRFKGWWRAIYILPWAIPEFVGALIWVQIFDPRFGWLNLAAGSWAQSPGYPGALNFASAWRENPSSALIVLLITAAWYGFPFMMLAASAGLKMIPLDVYDAAAIDGANTWNQFRMITWPLLLPLLAPAMIIRAIFSFNQFYLFLVLQPPDPLYTFSIISFFVFSDGGNYALSAAINLFTVIALIVLILWFNRWSKAAEGVTYA